MRWEGYFVVNKIIELARSGNHNFVAKFLPFITLHDFHARSHDEQKVKNGCQCQSDRVSFV